MNKIRMCFSRLLSFIFGNIVGRIMYDRRYFPKGKWFAHWYSQGWTWVMPDFCGRVLFHRNKGVPWPCSPYSTYLGKINFDVDDIGIFMAHNCYFQAEWAPIDIGRNTIIASGVGIITSNHNITSFNERSKIERVEIGENCWIGRNATLLPGVRLGAHTIVGAGSVVTKSFPDGNIIIAGNPAKIIRNIDEYNNE